MSTQDQFTIFDIPEVIEGIGLYLDQHSLSSCLRVSKSWYHDFLPRLWRAISVFDFDFNHIEFCNHDDRYLEAYRAPDGKYWEYEDEFERPGMNIFEQRRYPIRIRCVQDVNEPEDGYHHADKFSHWIRTIQAGSLQALKALGPGCVHLEYVDLNTDDKLYGVRFENAWLYEWLFERPIAMESRTNSLWLDLIRRNPKLKALRMSIQIAEEVHLQLQILDALARLEDLEELDIRWRDGRAPAAPSDIPDWFAIVQKRRGRPLKEFSEWTRHPSRYRSLKAVKP